jgi:hypothetical protein
VTAGSGSERTAEPDPAREAELASLAAELESLAPGLRVLDRGLSLDGRPVADLVVELEGALALVVVVTGDEPGLAGRALEALALAREHGPALAGHLGLAPGAGTPRVLLVAGRGLERAELARLGVLAGEGLWLLERHRLESQRGVTSFLRRVLPAVVPRPGGGPDPGAGAGAVEELDPELARLAGELAERLERLDPGIVCREAEGALEWTLGAEPLCRLVAAEGALVGHLAGSEVPHRLGALEDVDVFVDWVLSLHVERLERSGEPRAGATGAGPILTPEEIEAFRD